MDQAKIDAHNAELRRQAERKQDVDSQVNATNNVTDAVYKNTKSTAAGLKDVKGEVKVTNKDLAKSGDFNQVVDSINKMNVTTFMSTKGFHDMAENIATLSQEVQTLQQKLEKEGLTAISQGFQALVSRLESTAKQLTGTKIKVDDSVVESIDGLKKSIDGIDFNPEINVTTPEPKVVTTPVNLQPVTEALDDVEKAIKNQKIPETKVDMKPVTAGLKKVQDTIASLRFPVANYVLPFKDSTGKAVQLQLNSDGSMPAAGSVRTSKGNQATTITSSTAETTIVTAETTYFLDLYGLIITNTSATVCKVTIKDATAGTTRMVLQVPATDTRGFMLPADSAHKQSAINNNWTATCGTSVAGIEIAALFARNT